MNGFSSPFPDFVTVLAILFWMGVYVWLAASAIDKVFDHFAEREDDE